MDTVPYHQHDYDPLHEYGVELEHVKNERADLRAGVLTPFMDCKSHEQYQENIDENYDLDDQSEVPSMTRGSSSRSASSSIIICPSCGGSSGECQCQQSSHRVYSEMEFASIISRTQSPSVFAQTGQHDRLKHIKSLLQLQTSSSGTPTVRSSSRSIPLFLAPGPTIEEFPRNNDQSRTNISHHPDMSYNDQQNQNIPMIEDSEDDEEISDSEEEILSDQLTNFDDDLEALVLKAVGGDLELAAYLIPMFHRLQYTETLTNITQKVDSWYVHNALSINKCSPGNGTSQTPSSNARSPDGNGGARKRRRGIDSNRPIKESGDEDLNDDDEDDDDNQDSKGTGEDGEGAINGELPRLACPFNKVDPIKYGVQHGPIESTGKSQYRICAGPGFTSIQRLKEHLKRKHYPVQCDRCYTIFPGSDRAVCVTNLEAHRQAINMCQRREPILKEGISDAQWAQLDKKRSAKQVKSLSRVEKYWEIWEILFPETPRPRTPWYDDKTTSKTFAFAPGSQRFRDIFSWMLDRQVLDNRIRLPLGHEDEMKARILALAQEAFSIFSRVQPQQPSSSTSSSSRSHLHTSYLSGSYAQISPPQTGGRRPSATTALSQTYSLGGGDTHMQMSGSPTATDNQMLMQQGRQHQSQSQRSSMGPPPNNNGNMRLQQQFSTMQQTPSSQYSAISPMTMDFQQWNSQPSPSSATFFSPIFGDQAFDTAATSFTGGAVGGNAFGDVGVGVAEGTMLDVNDSDAQDLGDWRSPFA